MDTTTVSYLKVGRDQGIGVDGLAGHCQGAHRLWTEEEIQHQEYRNRLFQVYISRIEIMIYYFLFKILLNFIIWF